MMMTAKTTFERIESQGLTAMQLHEEAPERALAASLETVRLVFLAVCEDCEAAAPLSDVLKKVQSMATVPSLFSTIYVPAMQKLALLTETERDGLTSEALAPTMRRLETILRWFEEWYGQSFSFLADLEDDVIRPDEEEDAVRVEVAYDEKVLRPMEYHSREKGPILMRWATLIVLMSVLVWVLQHPFTAVGYTDRAVAHYEMQEYDLAMADLERAIRYDPTYAEAYYQRGLIYIAMDKKAFAVEDFEQAQDLGLVLTEDKSYAQVYFSRGNDYFEAELYSFALDDYDVALDLDPEAAEILAKRAETRLIVADFEGAIADIEKAARLDAGIEADARFAVAYFERADEAVDEGRTEAAIQDLNVAVSLDEDYLEAFALRGNLFLMKRQYKMAIDDFNAVLGLDNSLAEIYTKRGVAYTALDGYHQAIADLEMAKTLDADLTAPTAFYRAYFLRGEEFLGIDEFEDALADFDTAIELNAQDPALFAQRGVTKLALADYEEAIADYETAMTLDPTRESDARFAVGYYERGLAFAEEGDATRAMLDFDRAINLDDAYAAAYHARGLAHVAVGNYADALEDLAVALDLDETLTVGADYARAFLSRGKHLSQEGDWEGALADFDEALALQDDYAEAYFERGLVLLGQDEVDEALADFEQAIALDDAFAHEAQFGMAYQIRGLQALLNEGVDAAEDALADLERGLALDPTMTIAPEFAPAFYARGLAALETDDFEQALDDVSQAQALDADLTVDAVFAEAYVARAMAEETDTAMRLADLTQALTLDETNATVWLLRGDAFLAAGDFEAALADAEHALALDEELVLDAGYAEAYHARGLVALSEQDFATAIENAERAMALDTTLTLNADYAKAFYWKGMRAFVRGDFAEAVTAFEMTLTIDPSHPFAAAKLAMAEDNL